MKRRKRRARHAGRRDAFHLTMIAVLMTVLCLMIVNIKEPEQTEEEQPETTHAEVVQNPETIVQTAEETESKYKVFDGMSEDWGSDDLEGFVLYKLPEQYADKGYFPEKMQIYTRCLCKQNDVPYALVLAIIEHESGYEFDKVGDGGQSKGYMQIYEKWNMNRYPELKWLFHVPNGGSRNKQEAVKFKQMGVKAGVSDLCLPYPKGSYCGLFVEMKFGNNRQQDTQKEFLADMAAAGHFVATCYSAEEAIKVIEEYLNLSDAVHMERNLNMSIPNNSILKDGKIKN